MLYEYATVSFIHFTVDGRVSIWGPLRMVLLMENLGSDADVRYLDRGDGLTGVYLSEPSNSIH